MTNDEKIIELSKGKILLLVIGAAVFVALGIWMYLLNPAWIESQPRFNDPLLTHGIGIVSVVFFGLCAIVGIKKLFERRPGLILSAAGLSDNSSGVSAGLIPWDEIEGFDVFKIRRQKLLVVKLADPEKYMATEWRQKGSQPFGFGDREHIGYHSKAQLGEHFNARHFATPQHLVSIRLRRLDGQAPAAFLHWNHP